MTRKIITTLCILIIVPILFVAICALILFLAPGVKIFGVRYIAKGISECNHEGDVIVQNYETGEFKDIYINTYGVPITIQYANQLNSHLSFHQNFIGLTKSSLKKANVEVRDTEDFKGVKSAKRT